MRVVTETTGTADDPVYVLRREDGAICRTKDLVRVRGTLQRWTEMEYRPRSLTEALARLGTHIQMLRPSINPHPTKEQVAETLRVVRAVNKAGREGRLRMDL